MIENKCDYLIVKYKRKKPQIISMDNFLQCLKINNITPQYHYEWLKRTYGDKLEFIAGAINNITKLGYKVIAKVNDKGELELC